jgi:hypothetical protein
MRARNEKIAGDHLKNLVTLFSQISNFFKLPPIGSKKIVEPHRATFKNAASAVVIAATQLSSLMEGCSPALEAIAGLDTRDSDRASQSGRGTRPRGSVVVHFGRGISSARGRCKEAAVSNIAIGRVSGAPARLTS